MTLAFDLFWSVRSPYSYLATPRLRLFQQDFDVRCRVRPVYPHALRDAGAARLRDPLWLSYFKTDVVRTAQFLGLPLCWPRPDPVIVDPATGAPAEEQPFAKRLTYLIVAAEEEGAGLAFIDSLAAALWSPDTPDWTAAGVLEAVAQSAGLDLGALERRIAERPDYYENEVVANDAAERSAGHWGVPVMVFENEPFFGQDRIDQLVWRMRQRGLRPRNFEWQLQQKTRRDCSASEAVND